MTSDEASNPFRLCSSSSAPPGCGRSGSRCRKAAPKLPEHRLDELLARADTDSAHSRYNALIRRLVSFERAAECVA